MRPVGQVCSNHPDLRDTSAPAPTERFSPDKHMDLNIVRLADTIQTTNTLPSRSGLNGRSNITMWLANWKYVLQNRFLSTAVPVRRCLLRKPGGSAVTFDNRHTFVEHRTRIPSRSRSTCSSCSAVAALRRSPALSESDGWSGSPSATHARIEVPPGGVITFKFLINTPG